MRRQYRCRFASAVWRRPSPDPIPDDIKSIVSVSIALLPHHDSDSISEAILCLTSSYRPLHAQTAIAQHREHAFWTRSILRTDAHMHRSGPSGSKSGRRPQAQTSGRHPGRSFFTPVSTVSVRGASDVRIVRLSYERTRRVARSSHRTMTTPMFRTL